MTGNAHHARKAYASLHTAETPQADARPARGEPSDAADNDFNVEAGRLGSLRNALWEAFEAGPTAGLPTILIDLAAAYTGALRLQLNLEALASRRREPTSRFTLHGRAKKTENT